MVEYLEISGKKYPVRISYYVMKKVKEETGKSLGQALQAAEKEEDFGIHETILYAALKMGHYAEHGNMDLEVGEEEMPLMLDLCFQEYLKLFTSETFFPKELREMAEKQMEQKEKPREIKRKKE